MKKSIIFYAPLGKNTPPDKIGGAEAGCIKTKSIYESAGYDVVVVEKPAKVMGKIRFSLKMLVVPIILLFYIIKKGKNTPVHIVGFYTKVAKYERFLMNIAHFCGNKVIYEIRNGTMILTYKDGSEQYRKVLSDLLLKPEVVLCQGQEYVDFIRETWGVKRDYYPNYIMNDFVTPNNQNRPRPVKIIYFGRVTESKNIDVIIGTVSYLRNAGIDTYLEIIGGCNDKYKIRLENQINTLGLSNYVTIYGRKPFSFIAERLKHSHYFVFPSTEKQEGHSNSLTEAMGCGVVPIVSTAGFNRSICGNPDLVIDGIKASSYAEKIISIESGDYWRFYSNFVYERVVNNFTEKIVGESLLRCIEKLW